MSSICQNLRKSIGFIHLIFFALILCFLQFQHIDCNKSTTPNNNELLGESPDEESDVEIDSLPDAVKDIAYYLRNHKFNENDRRYEIKSIPKHRDYYKYFPKPPLRSLHWEVQIFCEKSFLDCVKYLKGKLRNVELQRTDDTIVIIQEQQWNLQDNAEQIEIANNDCKRMLELDDIHANPFEGPIERFQWRSTASYFMCQFTMAEQPELKHLTEDCDNFASCLDPNFGIHNKDPRANDNIPFACTSYSFCPDLCCPIKHLTGLENCWNHPDNPCFEANPVGQRECVTNRTLNTDFRDLLLNRWNVSCTCPQKGFEWNSLYGICVDVDECATNSHKCNLELEVCVNLPGSFKCVCKWGHIYNKNNNECYPSRALKRFQLRQKEELASETTTSYPSIIKRIGNKLGLSVE